MPYKKVLLIELWYAGQSTVKPNYSEYTYNEFMLTGNSFSLLLTIYYKLNRNELHLNES